MKEYTYIPSGVCARRISFSLEDGRIFGLRFEGGCNGNLKAIGRLVEGQPADRIAELLRGNECRGRGTSCADQLSKAIEQALYDEA